MNTTDNDTLNWMLGMGLFIGAMVLLASSSKAGYALVYYGLCLILGLLVLTQYRWIAKELSYINFAGPPQQGPQQASNKTNALSFQGNLGPAGIIPL